MRHVQLYPCVAVSSLMLGRLDLVFVIALMTGTAGYAQLPPASLPKSEATGILELVHIKPSDGSRVTGGTFLVAELRYKVDPFVKGRYFVMPQFAMTRPGMSGSGDLPRTAFDVEEPSGKLTISIPMSRILQDEQIARPLELRFFLNKRLESRSSSVLAKTELLHYIPE